jgi:hypothetical protein
MLPRTQSTDNVSSDLLSHCFQRIAFIKIYRTVTSKNIICVRKQIAYFDSAYMPIVRIGGESQPSEGRKHPPKSHLNYQYHASSFESCH